MRVTRLKGRVGIINQMCLWWAMILLPIIAVANDGLQISGYYKNFSTGLAAPAPDEPIIGAVNNRLRLNCAYAPTDTLSFDLSYDLHPAFKIPRCFLSHQSQALRVRSTIALRTLIPPSIRIRTPRAVVSVSTKISIGLQLRTVLTLETSRSGAKLSLGGVRGS